jgi:hypothetical protein
MTSSNVIKEYGLRDADYYMQRIPETIIKKLSNEEYADLKEVISFALPKPAPKLIDLRFVINLIVARYFFVVLIGRDRYKKWSAYQNIVLTHRNIVLTHRTIALRKFVHRFVAVLLLLVINLMVSLFVIMLTYLAARLMGFQPFSLISASIVLFT